MAKDSRASLREATRVSPSPDIASQYVQGRDVGLTAHTMESYTGCAEEMAVGGEDGSTVVDHFHGTEVLGGHELLQYFDGCHRRIIIVLIKYHHPKCSRP